MPLYLITGLPGSGKSTICAELKARGYMAYDADQDHLAHWFDAAGKPVPFEAEERTPEFIQNHTRDIAEQTVAELANAAQDTTIFLCGDPENEADLQHLFTAMFALMIDEAARQHRLDTRQNNTWGKLPHEREYDLAHAGEALSRYRTGTYTILQADRPVADIVDTIFASIQ